MHLLLEEFKQKKKTAKKKCKNEDSKKIRKFWKNSETYFQKKKNKEGFKNARNNNSRRTKKLLKEFDKRHGVWKK